MRRDFSNALGTGIVACLLASCAGDGGKYPSLAVRDVERVSGVAAPAPEVEPVALPIRSLAPSQSLAALVASASASHQTFLARAPTARRLAASARGSSLDSNVRGNAIVALSDLRSLRTQTGIALADLDLLVAERANRFQPTDDAIAARGRVLDLIDAQDRTLASLWGILGQ